MKWLPRSSQMIIFGGDEDIDTSSSGLQIDETSTSPAESPSVTDDDTWSGGDEGEITRDLVAAGSGAIDGAANFALTDVQVSITKGFGCLKFDHKSAFNAAN